MDVSCVTNHLYHVVSWLSSQPFLVALLTGKSFLQGLRSLIAAVLGAVLLTSAIFGLLRFFWRHIRPGVNLAKYGLKDGAYAGLLLMIAFP